MNQKLYKNYADDIAQYLRQGKKNDINKSFSTSRLNENLSSNIELRWLDRTKNEADFLSLSALDTVTSFDTKYHEKLGAHPSFNHLKGTKKVEHHYIVSMFIDVRNSTALFKKYTPEVVANICRTIQLAAIHTCWYFDGYIHRLQGDGLMVYFGGKGISKQKAIDNALLAASFVNYFVKNDLKNLFEEQGVNRIYTRIGIDFGDDRDTIWHDTGAGECSEITTTSLHTSLSSKMQAQAESNGIVVGDHVYANKQTHKDYFKYKKYKVNGEEKDFIYEIPDENFRYKQYDFNWERYLRNHPLISTDDEGNLILSGNPKNNNTNINTFIPHLEKNVEQYKPYLK